MSAAIKSYYQDVKTFTDEELESLSAEMREAYECSGYDDYDCWTDDEAEARYYEMREEVGRRTIAVNLAKDPTWKPAPPSFYVREAMKMLAGNLNVSAALFNREYDQEFSKVGDCITIRKPYRFTS